MRIVQRREIGSHAFERTEDFVCGRIHPATGSGWRHAPPDLLKQRLAGGIRKSAYETGHGRLRHVHLLRSAGETSQAHDGFECGHLGQGSMFEELAAVTWHGGSNRVGRKPPVGVDLRLDTTSGKGLAHLIEGHGAGVRDRSIAHPD
ncbi:MAG TPA: hypothetical protein VLW55_04620 [Burkholderiaceae bacterium]|nr:hypothetical protein [Burkholderiaceae bacterium]